MVISKLVIIMITMFCANFALLIAVVIVSQKCRQHHRFTAAAIQVRIIGGDQVSLLQYPYMAAIVIKKHRWATEDKLRCGATIIHKQWALTAAHCLMALEQYKMAHICVRTNSISWNAGIEHRIVKYLKHRKYIAYRHDYDIGLVRVYEPLVRTGSSATIIDLPPRCYKYVWNSSAIAAGWGYVNASKQVEQRLRAAKVTLFSQGYCQKKYRTSKASEKQDSEEYFDDISCFDFLDDYEDTDTNYSDGGDYYDDGDIRITTRMVCAGSYVDNKDACSYDSGGPLIQKKTVIGVISWGPEVCGTKGWPGVYVRVAYFYKWIRGIVDGVNT